MLKIVDYTMSSNGTLEIDKLIPLSFRAPPYPRQDPFIWRTGDFQKNLLEIKIDRVMGEIFSATLVIFTGVMSKFDLTSYSHAKIIYGLPVVDLAEFSSGVTNEISPIELCRFEDQIYLHFGTIAPPTMCILNGRARFLIRESSLVGIGFSNLTAKEIELLDASLSQWG